MNSPKDIPLNLMQLPPRDNRDRPRVGVVAAGYPGYSLGEEMLEPKLREMLSWLGAHPLILQPVETRILNEGDARKAGEELAAMSPDCILVVLATFIPDYFLVELLKKCDRPVFLYAIEREIQCLSLVCGPLLTGALYNLGSKYDLVGADISDEQSLARLLTFARASMMKRLLASMRLGYTGGKCPIMMSMAADEFTITRKLGTVLIDIPVQEFYSEAEKVTPADAKSCWNETRSLVNRVDAAEDDGLLSGRYLLACRRMVERYALDAWSLNCFPHLKSKICIPLARLNDEGIAAACEGDVHSTILMHLTSKLAGRASVNADFLRMYESPNEILFSHCGCGAFTLAKCKDDICLQCSIETKDGLSICYPTHLPGQVTLLNLMSGSGSLRLAGMSGLGVETDLEYAGTPLRVKFKDPVRDILRRVSRHGAGHHWNGGAGDYLPEFKLLCSFLDIEFNVMTRSDDREF